MINAGMAEFAGAAKRCLSPPDKPWRGWSAALRSEYLKTLEPVPVPGTLNLSEVVAWLRERLPAGTIITNGAGNFSGWVQRFYQYTGFRTQLAPTNGAMGYGVPAAVAAKLVHPERMVVCFAGDGDFLMTGQELATAVQYGAAVIFCVVNNGMYGTIRMHQERDYPARVYGYRAAQSRFRGTGARVRRARGAGGTHRGLRRRVRARSRARASLPCSNCASIPRRSPRARL